MKVIFDEDRDLSVVILELENKTFRIEDTGESITLYKYNSFEGLKVEPKASNVIKVY
jgi:hypothetical protein